MRDDIYSWSSAALQIKDLFFIEFVRYSDRYNIQHVTFNDPYIVTKLDFTKPINFMIHGWLGVVDLEKGEIPLRNEGM